MAFATRTQHLSRTKIETKDGSAKVWRFAAAGNDQNSRDPYTLDFEYSLAATILRLSARWFSQHFTSTA